MNTFTIILKLLSPHTFVRIPYYNRISRDEVLTKRHDDDVSEARRRRGKTVSVPSAARVLQSHPCRIYLGTRVAQLYMYILCCTRNVLFEKKCTRGSFERRLGFDRVAVGCRIGE